MVISESAWLEYVEKLSKISEKAASLMQEYLDENLFDDDYAMVEYAYALATKYGEAATALASEMYDALADASGIFLPPAEPAATATLEETAKTVRGTLKNQKNGVAAAVGRLVKMAAADTTLQNAARDGAEFAWVPHGDTCAFCIMLASNGWQHISKRTLKKGHAEHIHANCDCQYAVRFDESTTVQGYDEDRYKSMFYNAPIDEWNTADGEPPAGNDDADKPLYTRRLNALRREAYRRNTRGGLLNVDNPLAEEIDLG